jgi:hypothetical protein
MIALKSVCRRDKDANWQTTFTKMLPEIERRLSAAFWKLDPASKEEAIAEGVAHSLFAYMRLYEKGSASVATPSNLTWFSSRHVKRGRPAAGRMNCKEPLSRYGQLSHDIKIERRSGKWIDAIVDDKRASVADQVAAKLDVSAWFATLTLGVKQIAKDLAFGFSTSEVARKHGVTAGRISQLRRTLETSWLAFQQETTTALAQ